jgi:GNAT superfamily N-acetyltransferase
MYQYEAMAAPATRRVLGITTRRIGGGVALAMRNDPTGYWNKALGFGGTEPVSAALIDDVIDFYRAEDVPAAVLQIAPHALPTEWPAISRRHGLRADSRWTKLIRSTDLTHHWSGRTDLRIAATQPSDHRLWASTALAGFGMPDGGGLGDMMAAALAHPGFHPFAAWAGRNMVATGNLFVHGAVGSLNSAATLPGHRQRGAQSALIAVRAEAAARAGCRWLCAETGKPAVGQPSSSLNNLMRNGFHPLYDRQNWTWSAAGTVA